MGHEAEAGHVRVAERLAALRTADDQLARALEAASVAVSGVPVGAIGADPADVLATTLGTLRDPLPPELNGYVEAATSRLEAADEAGHHAANTPTAAHSRPLQDAYVPVGAASGAAAALFTTGRLMFVGAACDLATARLTTYANALRALNALLPQVIAWELREDGLPCRCVCPMCSIGACGCIWASLHSIDVAWGGPGLPGPDEDGIPLRSPPRPGSQLAAAGVRQWDRITAVDAEPVRSPMELQSALRRHEIGDEVRLEVSRASDVQETVVRHVSDLP